MTISGPNGRHILNNVKGLNSVVFVSGSLTFAICHCHRCEMSFNSTLHFHMARVMSWRVMPTSLLSDGDMASVALIAGGWSMIHQALIV